VPLLQEAVASWPEDSTDIEYAYALYNLGKSLNRGGRAQEAIPYLERRLRWADQRATVQAELDLARQNAGQG
jgi:tetratricopeptide (TPR) repeat protein